MFYSAIPFRTHVTGTSYCEYHQWCLTLMVCVLCSLAGSDHPQSEEICAVLWSPGQEQFGLHAQDHVTQGDQVRGSA